MRVTPSVPGCLTRPGPAAPRTRRWRLCCTLARGFDCDVLNSPAESPSWPEKRISAMRLDPRSRPVDRSRALRSGSPGASQQPSLHVGRDRWWAALNVRSRNGGIYTAPLATHRGVRRPGLEPGRRAWKARVLPLDHRRSLHSRRDSRLRRSSPARSLRSRPGARALRALTTGARIIIWSWRAQVRIGPIGSHRSVWRDITVSCQLVDPLTASIGYGGRSRHLPAVLPHRHPRCGCTRTRRRTAPRVPSSGR